MSIGALVLFPAVYRTEARTQLTASTIQEVDTSTLKELLNTFELAEQAMQDHDLDGIMAVYSEGYLYHGLKNEDIRKIWKQLLDAYSEFESVHTFSVIRVVGSQGKMIVEMTCTGVIWGTSKVTTLRAPIDSWYEEIHYLRREDGRWRIVGHVGGESEPALQFGVAAHPLF